jgi:PAS domain S-box-containing protein
MIFLRRLGWHVALFFVFLFSRPFNPALADGAEGQKSVLVIYTDEKVMPGNVIFDRSLRETFKSISPYPIAFYIEYLELASFPDESSRQEIYRFYQLKYAQREFDLIIAAGAGALHKTTDFVREVFPGAPLIFFQVERSALKNKTLGPGITGVFIKVEYLKTLDLALRLHPDTRRVAVIAGVSEKDRYFLARAREEFRKYEERLEFTYLTGLSIKELQQEVSHLPEQTIIFYLAIFQDAAGQSFAPADALTPIAQTANAPIYGVSDTYLEQGVVGGHMLSYEAQGVKVAEMGVRILQGEDPSNLPIIDNGADFDMFNWRQLRRWGISEDSLPPGSLIRHREVPLWEQYERYIVSVIALIIVQTLLITGLLVHRRRRRQAERQLDERLRFETLLADLSAAFAYLPTGEVDHGIEKWMQRLREFLRVDWSSIVEFSPNGTRYRFTYSSVAPGIEPLPERIPSEKFPWYTKQLIKGKTLALSRLPDDLPEEANAERQYCLRTGIKSSLFIPLTIGGSSTGALTFVMVRSYRNWPEELVSRLYLIGDIFATTIARERANAEVMQNRARLAGVIESAMDAIITIDENQRIILFNDAAEEMFGCSEAEAKGQLIERFIPERFREAHREGIRSFGETKVTRRAIGRLGAIHGLRADGREFPLEASVSQVEAGGERLYTVILRDITWRLQAENALRESEKRFRLLADATPILVWQSGVDKLCTYFNRNWLEFTGRTAEQELGRGWAEGVHPDDYARCLQVYNEAFDRRELFEMEYRLRRADGEYRWILDRGVPLFASDGVFAGYLGGCIDITERKRDEEELQAALAEVSELKNRLQEENIYLQEEIKLAHNFDEIIGNSDALKEVLSKIEQVAPTGATVLLLGETGTGKELAANAIHDHSAQKDRPLVKVNCSSLPATLIESELFGHEKGAFTGAQVRKIGRFELANGGTIFLDEIGELPLEVQPKLLRVLQDGAFERLGGSQTIKVSVRVIAATNRNLKTAVEKSLFREDLWYRLNVFPITMPPLRQRREDIKLLVGFFVDKFSRKMGRHIESVAPATMKELQNYDWPGNVRELSNVIERAVINTHGPVLVLADKLDVPRENGPLSNNTKSLEEMEREFILQRLELTDWRIEGIGGAAISLGINSSTLRNRMKKLGIRRPKIPPLIWPS